MLFFFFFSSRRRHTRWTGDWSSDVCSSDLFEQAAVVSISALTALQALTDVGHVQPGQQVLIIGASGGVGSYAVQRSEERRVGKECRSRGSADHEKKKKRT